MALIDAGADAIKIGIGPGSSARSRRHRSWRSQFSAVLSPPRPAAKATSCIADGGVRLSGDVAKAVAAGADCVMVGSLLAGTEGPGEVSVSGAVIQIIPRHGLARCDGAGIRGPVSAGSAGQPETRPESRGGYPTRPRWRCVASAYRRFARRWVMLATVPSPICNKLFFRGPRQRASGKDMSTMSIMRSPQLSAAEWSMIEITTEISIRPAVARCGGNRTSTFKLAVYLCRHLPRYS